VGQENVGKSTLLRALRHNSLPKVGKAPRKVVSDALEKSQQPGYSREPRHRCRHSQHCLTTDTQNSSDLFRSNISTDGIDISQWVLPVKVPSEDGTPAEVKEVTLSAWDFAGTPPF
jgi:GTPase SAR1 family protein